jgi:hypothetical protein
MSYRFHAVNHGPSNATGVSVTPTLPACVSLLSSDCGGQGTFDSGVWHLGVLASGASADLFLLVSVDSPQAPAIITFSAVISGDQIDPDPANNTDSENSRVIPPNKVGGEIGPIDRTGLLAPWLTAAVVLMIGAGLFVTGRRKMR